MVAFTGRAGELDELQQWCASDLARSVRALTGAGGVGKTRLAREVAARCAACGGRWRLVTAGDEAEAVADARAAHSGRLLLIVDDAETRTGLAELLEAALADRGPVRVLLVARSLGEWWDRLVEGSDDAAQLVSQAEPVQLDAPVRDDASDAELVEAALPHFARALSVEVPGRAAVRETGQRLPVLVLHAAALVALLRFYADSGVSPGVSGSSGVLDELLEHEARFWRCGAGEAGLPDQDSLVKQVVAAAALLGAGSLAEAVEVVRRVPDLAAVPQEQQLRWALWLYALYPRSARGRLGSPRPDLLAETHVAGQLGADPDLARSCLRDLPPQQAEHALMVLARATTHRPATGQLIATALRDDLAHLGVAAARVALAVPGGLGRLLAEAIADAPAPPEVLADLALSLPRPSLVLAQAQLAATMRVLGSLPPGTTPQARAQWHHRTGVILAQLGRQADALRPAEDALAIRRELASANPDRYRPDLAASLANLATRLAEMGRAADALGPQREAVLVYQQLAGHDAGRYRADLAAALTALCVLFCESGRPGEAEPVSRESIAVCRELVTADPARYGPDLERVARVRAQLAQEAKRR